MRKTTILLTAAALALAAPAAANADSITLNFGPDRVEEVGFLVTASGVGSEDARVYATIKPAGPAGCGPTYNTDPGGQNVIFWENAEGAYNVAGTAKVDDPGQYLLCGWLQEFSGSSEALATGSTLVDVRPARASLTISGPKSLHRGRTARFFFSGAAELNRSILGTVKRAGGRGCGSSSTTDSGHSLSFLERVQGTFSVAGVPWKYDIKQPGRYVICAWVQESSSDLAPEAFAAYKFTVRRHG